ncbi:MAG: prolipoprotein diacylglyceryl transferase [Chloroflexi bacterium]|nr:prolipoprotein diacylglyceryl transferase [Chloroflexota bacterium]
MLTVNIDPTIVQLGPLALSWYGLAIAAAITAGSWLTWREAAGRGIPTEPLGDLIIWVIGGGIIGARLLHVVDRWDFYAENPMAILAVQNGGLAILGAILGGTVGGVLGAHRLGLPIWPLADATAPGVVLGQAIGRLGCLVTGDALGPATDGSWGIVYLNEHAVAPALGVAYQPTFLYEMLLALAIFGALWSVRGRLHVDGQLFALYLGLYALGKFGLTFLRMETVWLWGLQEAQLVALGLLAVAITWGWLAARGARTQNARLVSQ